MATDDPLGELRVYADKGPSVSRAACRWAADEIERLRTELEHDDRCEAEFLMPPGAYTPCGCRDRAHAKTDGMAAVARRYRDGWTFGHGDRWWWRTAGDLTDPDVVIEHEPVTPAELAALDALEAHDG